MFHLCPSLGLADGLVGETADDELASVLALCPFLELMGRRRRKQVSLNGKVPDMGILCMDVGGGGCMQRPCVFSARSVPAINEISTAKIEKSIRVQPFKKASNSPCKTGDRELVPILIRSFGIGHYILIRRTQNV